MTTLFFSFVVILANSFNIADSLLDEENYKRALIEYERLDFFSPDSAWKYKKGFCYRALGRYQDAVKVFESLGESRELIKTYVLMHEYPLAEYESKKIVDKELIAWVLFLEGKWDESISAFNEIGREDVADNIHSPFQKDPRKAQILSSIVPGLGEIYVGKPLPSLFTFSLNLLFGGLAIKSFADHRTLDGVLITIFLWSRFYQGGIKNAGKAVYRYNKEKKSAYIEEMTEKYGRHILNWTQIDADEHR